MIERLQDESRRILGASFTGNRKQRQEAAKKGNNDKK